MHLVNCRWIPQQAKITFVAESATLLLYFDLVGCFGLHKQISKTLYRSKSFQKQANLGNPKLYVGIYNTGIPKRHPRNFPRDPNSRDLHTPKCANIQCTVWCLNAAHRNHN